MHLGEEKPEKFKVETAAAAKSLQLCPIPCDPVDGSPPGSPIPGILQARKKQGGIKKSTPSAENNDWPSTNCQSVN